MATPFNQIFEAAAKAIEDTFGVAAVITPRTRSAYAEAATDENRDPIEVLGKLTIAPGVGPLRGKNASNNFSGQTLVGKEQAEFWLSPEATTALPYMPVKGDLITFPDDASRPAYVIVHVRPDNVGSTTFTLAVEDLAE